MNGTTRPAGVFSLGLIQRLAFLAALLIAEWFPISVFIGTGRGGGDLTRRSVPFLALFFALACFQARDTVRRISAEVRQSRLSWRPFALHAAVIAAFLALSAISIHDRALGVDGGPLLGAGWFACGFLTIVTAACAFLPARYWWQFLRATGALSIYAAGAAVVAWQLIPLVRSIWVNPHWRPVTDLTFRLVAGMLHWFVPGVVSNPVAHTIGTSTFEIFIADSCSGLEGAGLMLVFSVLWLWLFRKDFLFPRALLLIPAGILAMFGLNVARICALILIGNAGHPRVAIDGFHSQAGWIAFNLLVLGFSLVAPRIPWFRRGRAVSVEPLESVPNPTVPYLLPFAAILAAAMIARAASGGFEWLYPLRFFAAALVIWLYRARYHKLHRGVTWLAPAAGLAIFLLWLALPATSPDKTTAASLAALSAPVRFGWLLFRVAAAVITVPIAEELAFRGFLLRRLVTPDFESIGFRSFTWFSFLASSLAFGLMHGGHWLAGTIAGCLFALLMLRRGSLADSIVAHAVANALLAAWVLSSGHFELW